MMMHLRHYAMAALLCLLPLTGGAQRPFESVEGDPMQTRIYTLDNGLKVYLSVNREKPRIQTYIAVKTGSRNDPAETTGLAHYLEHLMFKGTRLFGTTDAEKEAPLLDEISRRYEHYRTVTDPEERKRLYHGIDSVSQLAAQYNIPNEYDKMMASIGSEGSNAYTSNDVTCYIEDIPSNELELWARIQADRFQHMVVRGFHTELETVYEEYNMGLAHDGEKMFEALGAKLFPNHPYGTQTTIGKGEHLKNPSIVNIMDYYRRYYVPNNTAICMAGDLDPEETLRIIERHFGSWAGSPTLSRPEYAPLPPLTAPQDTSVVGLEAEQLYLAWRFPAANDAASDTLQLLSRLLYNGTAGLLDLHLNQQMKAQETFAFHEGLHDYSLLLLGGTPREGQSLEEVRDLLLQEVGRLREGDFSEGLLQSILNNEKRYYYKRLQSNEYRADQFVSSFIHDIPWERQVGRLPRLERIGKKDLMDFARRHLGDAYVCVYKRQGEDTNLQKVEKPAITPIPTNNHLQSRFLQEVVSTEVEPIAPSFIDFRRDISHATTRSGKEILLKSDPDEKLFTLQWRYPLGSETEPLYAYATDYLDYLGTDKLSNEEIKARFYGLACDYEFSQDNDALTLTLTGLSEHMKEAIGLLHTFIQEAVPDTQAYHTFIGLVEKARSDQQTSQRDNFFALRNLAVYGPYNPLLSRPSIARLQETSPETLLRMLRELNAYPFTTLYYGPASAPALISALADWEQGAGPARQAPASKPFVKQTVRENEIFLAPYDAKNIYMAQYLNEDRDWKPENSTLNALFNEYFGGGMNAIVFQEMREARGLAYSAGAYYSSASRKGEKESFSTQIITQNDKMTECIRQFRQLLDSVPEREPNFLLAKESLTKRIATSRTLRFSLLLRYIDARKLGIDYDLNEHIYRTLPDVSLRDLMDFARAHVSQKPFRYIILGNEQELDLPTLESLGRIRRLSTGEIFGD